MKNKFLLAVIASLMLLSSCGQNNTPAEISSDPVVDTNNPSSTVESTSSEPVSDEVEMGGTADICEEHILSYHFVLGRLAEYVGKSAYKEWSESLPSYDEYGRTREAFNIQAFIEHFQVPREAFEQIINDWATDSRVEAFGGDREAFLMENGYTDAQIDALYSGDQAKINEAFCGEMAYYNPEDGELYSIYWLSDHTAEEYESAGVPEAEVERILGLAEEEGGKYAEFAKEAKEAASEYAAMN